MAPVANRLTIGRPARPRRAAQEIRLCESEQAASGCTASLTLIAYELSYSRSRRAQLLDWSSTRLVYSLKMS